MNLEPKKQTNRRKNIKIRTQPGTWIPKKKGKTKGKQKSQGQGHKKKGKTKGK